MQSHINVGSGSDITITELAEAISKAVGFKGKIQFDPEKPDGAPRKWMDSSRLNGFGWQAQLGLEAGLIISYQNFLLSLIREKSCNSISSHWHLPPSDEGWQ
jgi:GDP-L-fucose synthase